MSQRNSAVLTIPEDTEGFKRRVLEAFGGVSIEQIADLTNINHHTLGNYLRKKRDIPTEELKKISKASNTSIHWLLTGEGSKWISGKDSVGEESPVYFGEKEREIIQELAAEAGRNFDEQVRDLVLESLLVRGLITEEVESITLEYFGEEVPNLIPMRLYGEIAAGEPIDVIEHEETVLVAEDFARAGDVFVLRVRGDSMIEEGILDRDLIICRRTNNSYNGDKVVALIDGQKATVKKFFLERGRVRLQPANPNHKPILLAPERVQIQGVVIGIQRRT
jgi:repressor LexA